MKVLKEELAHRFSTLDVLRGVAILLVLTGHFFAKFMPGKISFAIVHSCGIAGVLLFFHLSGYLIIKSLTRESIRSFFIRRSFKIFPAYWVSIATIAVISYFFPNEPSMGAWSYFTNILLLPDILGGSLLAGHYWSLVIEAKFYLFIALVYYFVPKRLYLVVPLVLLAINFAFWMVFGRGSVLLTYMPVFFLGIGIYLSTGAEWNKKSTLRFAFLVLLVSALYLIFSPIDPVNNAVYTAAASLLLFIGVRKNVENKLLSYFGKISYSLYLLNSIIGFKLEELLVGSAVPPVLAAIVAVIASILAADISYRFIERPFVRMGRSVETMIEPKNSEITVMDAA